jgi:hypothetical protein
LRDDSTERKERPGADETSRDESSPKRRSAVEAVKTQESSGLARDATLPSWMTDCWSTQALGDAAFEHRVEGGNVEKGSPGDEPGGVDRQGKALKGRTP